MSWPRKWISSFTQQFFESFWLSPSWLTNKRCISTFLSIIYFLQFLSHFLFLLLDWNKFIGFHTNVWVKYKFLASKCISLIAVQQASTAKLPEFNGRFQTEVSALWVTAKLYEYGFGTSSLKLTHNYFMTRHQRVKNK